jgi:DNA-directed RNA polymerase specialized sigma24 family protein
MSTDGTGSDPADPGLSAIMSERRHLINLTYRLLGSLADAEDVVQETYTRWYAMSREQQQAIESPGGWLMTVATLPIGSPSTSRSTWPSSSYWNR